MVFAWFLATGLSVLLYASGLFVVFTPLPLAVLSVRRGLFSGVTAFLSAATVLFALYHFAGPLMLRQGNWAIPVLPLIPLSGLFSLPQITYLGLLQFSYYGIVGLLLAVAAKTSRMEKGMGLILGVSLLLTIGGGALFQVFFHLSLLGKVQEVFRLFFEQWVQASREAGTNGDRNFLTNELIPSLTSTLFFLLPSLLINGTLISTSLNIVILKRWLIRQGCFKQWGDFTRWSLPEGWIWFLIVLGAVFFFNQYGVHQTWVQWLTLNLLLIHVLIYFFQGAAILAFYWKKSIPPLMRLLGYVIFFFLFQVVIVLMTLAGIFDFWFDFRKLKRDSGR